MEASNPNQANHLNVKRPDQVRPYRFHYWTLINGEDNSSEVLNVLGMFLSMMGLLLKYKICAWLGFIVAAVSYANQKVQNNDFKQSLSQFCLAGSAIIMSYATNPQPMSVYFTQQATNSLSIPNKTDATH